MRSALAVGVLLVLAIGAIALFEETQLTTSSETSSPMSSDSSTNVSTTTVNGVVYFVDNVTSDMYAEDPGTFHFYNGSVTFLGVTFQTICTDHYSQCPGVPPPQPGTTITVASGAGISLNVTFADHASEALKGGFPLVPVSFRAFTTHGNPQAGILIVNPGGAHGDYKSYLLVSHGPGSGSGQNNDAIAVTGLGLCSSDCVYPSPYAYATVLVNASAQLSTLAVYVNGTYNGTPLNYSDSNSRSSCSVPQNSTTRATTTCTVTASFNSLTSYAYLYKGSLPTNLIPAVKGDTYIFKFVATFQDGLTSIAIAETVAD